MLSVVIPTMFLAACPTAPSRDGACDGMPLAVYSAQQQLRVAAEMAAQPDAEWPGFVRDYRILRQRRRAMCGEW